jgi:hypothetical protein
MKCLHCGAETSNGLALCELCRRLAASIFEMLPIYFRNLARWTPGRAGSRDVPGSRVLYMGEVVDPERTGDRISDALDEAFNMLTNSAQELVDSRPYLGKLLNRLKAAQITQANSVAWLCVGFERYMTSMATLDMCGDFIRDLTHHEGRLRELTESAAPGWYAGGCRQLTGFDEDGAATRCGSDTHVVPGLTWVTCPDCGATTYARDHIDVVLDEARGWVAGPMRIAEAVVALVDTELSIPRLHKRISKWGERDRIEVVRRVDAEGDPVGPKRYRMGEVLDALYSDGPTRASSDISVAS